MNGEPQGYDDDTDMTEADIEAMFANGTPVRLLTPPDRPWYTVVREESGNVSASQAVVHDPRYGEVASRSTGSANAAFVADMIEFEGVSLLVAGPAHNRSVHVPMPVVDQHRARLGWLVDEGHHARDVQPGNVNGYVIPVDEWEQHMGR